MTESTSASSGSVSSITQALSNDTSTIILIVVVSVIGVLLAGFFIVSYVKERLDKKKTLQATNELRKQTAILWYETSIQVQELMRLNKIDQANFVPSIGELKMSELNGAAKKFLENVIKSDRFQSCFRENETHTEFVSRLFELKDTNSNLWEKRFPTFETYFADAAKKAKESAKQFQNTDYFELKTPEALAQEAKDKYESLKAKA